MIVQLRRASTFVANYMEMAPSERYGSVATLARRIVPAAASAPRIALLDTGAAHRHPMLTASLPASRCHSASSEWATTDHDGHGTNMAGIALFGDLEDVISGDDALQLSASLESVVITAPQNRPLLAARDAIERAVQRVEAESHPRVFCIAATAEGEAENGRTSSSSAVLDALAYNEGTRGRLFCVAVGNVPTAEQDYRIEGYAHRNPGYGVQSPAQAMNALAIGASTMRFADDVSVAPSGDLSPTSRTAQSWMRPHPNKPDIVMEGGNHSIEPGGRTSRPGRRDLILTTASTLPTHPLGFTGESSAATAAAAGLAARLMARYPALRVETIRGLLVHSARWTPAMNDRLARLRAGGISDARSILFACYGWGIPDEDQLLSSTGNAFTMIFEDEIRPFEQGANSIKLRETRYIPLPWPRLGLRGLRQTPVEMRCTLSYFIEPEPGASSRDRADRYPSYRLGFDLKRSDETHAEAKTRVNDPLDSFAARNDNDGWLIGARPLHRGTLQQDVWSGPAFQLAERDGLSIIPSKGWWSDRPRADRFDRAVRYSLIVSLKAPVSAGDLYTEAANAIPANVLLEAAIPLTV